MEGKYNWNAQKKDLWKSPVKELQNKLNELQKEKMKAEMNARGFMGDISVPMKQDRIMNSKQSHVNLKNLRRKIAFIKNVLNLKLK